MSRTPRLRRYFFVGLVVIAPVGVTVLVLRWIFERLDAILGRPIQAALGIRIPGLGFVLLGLVVLAVGWVVHQAVGLRILRAWNETLLRFPVAGRLYNAASQIVQSVVSDKSRIFKRTVLVPYPTDGLWAVGFVTNDDAPVMTRIVGQACVNVFVPTTPNPTSGFLLVIPRTRVIETDISIEEAMKFVISAGAVSPVGGATRSPRRGLDLEDLFRERAP
ncbi:MAG: DUF502 domain-containing protein [Gemmatimonadota bacterium]|nr:DUF502 domain-containing protein [Gemmatimonadota bacterium]MDH4349659.1 DUF502 domain-containing protein [Gemmatimonadota bacterium]MDH5195855.1 DUF502 domain-containing protein [Gemmatimonadota bacterium]